MTSYLIGTDEAGYGPNLGPLVVVGTLWEVEESPDDLFELLKDSVAQVDRGVTDRITIGDSKQIHDTHNLGILELPALALIQSGLGGLPDTAGNLLKAIQSASRAGPDADAGFIPEHEIVIPLPVQASGEAAEWLSRRFIDDCNCHGVKLAKIVCRTISPIEFNRGLETLGNKASVLTANTLQIVRELIDATTEPSEIMIACDKHGGRNKYAAPLQQWLTEQMVRIGQESTDKSVYQFEEQNRAVEIHFTAGGEQFMPTAVSSMIAKYVRELAMISFNSFWIEHLPHLKPTKGYPLDAKRFWTEIEGTQRQLQIPKDSIWRLK